MLYIKGSAFIVFKNKESADKIISAPEKPKYTLNKAKEGEELKGVQLIILTVYDINNNIIIYYSLFIIK